jgi:sugar O-acyltransferase (sialic acid O-acetyltransferase NeuD family)
MTQAQPRVLILGAGGFGRAVADALGMAGGLVVAGFLDDRGGDLGRVLGLPVLGRIADLPQLRVRCDRLVVAIGDNHRRAELAAWVLEHELALQTVVHPRATVSTHAVLGDGAMVMAGAVVGTEVRLGRCAIVNAGAVVDHHAQVGDCAHLGVGALMAGGSRLGHRAWLQEGAVLRAGQQVPDDTVVIRG